EPEERGTHPVNRTEQDRDHRRLAFVMAIKSPLGFNVVAVIRGEKRRTDQKQDDLGFLQVLVELTPPFLACPDSSVMPTYDIALPLQESQVLLELVPQSLILVGVSVEQADRSGWLLGGCGLRRSSSRTTWSVWSDRGIVSGRFGTRNRLCQPKSLLAFGGDVGAEPISQASSLDEPLTFESLQPVPHVPNEHLGCDSEAGVVHVPGRISLQITEDLEDQPLAAFEFHVRFSFDRWSGQIKQWRKFNSHDNVSCDSSQEFSRIRQ